MFQIWLLTMADSRELIYQTGIKERAEGVLEFLEADNIEAWESFTYELVEIPTDRVCVSKES